MKSVLLSINHEWCDLILRGAKTEEVRRTCPKLKTPFKVYIYCTKVPNWLKSASPIWKQRSGKVIGAFVCDKIERVNIPYPAYQNELDKRFIEKSCVSYYGLHRYASQNALRDDLLFWHISDLEIYDKPRNLHMFCRFNFKSLYGTNICGNTKCENYIPSDSWMQPPECAIDGCYLKRPPQSWCYVEELGCE